MSIEWVKGGESWMQTSKDTAMVLDAPTPDMVDLEVIATHLSRLCRYTGAVWYPVGAHAIYVQELLHYWGETRAVRRCGLMHDSQEAYMGDWSTPMKRALEHEDPAALKALEVIEDRLKLAISQRFDLPALYSDLPPVKRADLVALATEKAALMGTPPRSWEIDLPPTWGVERLKYLAEATPEYLRKTFLLYAKNLGIK